MSTKPKKEIDKYFNFPVQLLSGFMADHNGVLKNVMCYCLYNYTKDKDFADETEAFEASAIHFGIDFKNLKSLEAAMWVGLELYNSLPEKSPRTGINLNSFHTFYMHQVSEFDKLTLLGFLALKSIIGEKLFGKTTNSLFFSRMDGSIKTIGFDQLSDELWVYASSKNKINYWSAKIRSELESSWNVVFWGKAHGFFLSFKLNPEELIYQAEKIKLISKNKEKIRNAEKNELAKKALQRLHSELKI